MVPEPPLPGILRHHHREPGAGAESQSEPNALVVSSWKRETPLERERIAASVIVPPPSRLRRLSAISETQ
jgi:hypothetical protein